MGAVDVHFLPFEIFLGTEVRGGALLDARALGQQVTPRTQALLLLLGLVGRLTRCRR